MSALISSAVGGKQAAPKGAPRRRAPASNAPQISAADSAQSTAAGGIVPSNVSTASPAAESSPAQVAHAAPVQDIRSSRVEWTAPLAEPPAAPASVEDRRGSPRETRERTAPPEKPSSEPAKRVKISCAKQARTRSDFTTSGGSENSDKAAQASRKSAAKRKANNQSAEVEPPAMSESVDREAATQPRKRISRREKRIGRTRAPSAGPVEMPEGQHGPEGDDEVQEEHFDSELHEIDVNTTKMYELGHHGPNGKTSEREKKMSEIDWAEVARQRQEQYAKAFESVPSDEATGAQENSEGQNDTAAEEADPGQPSRVSYKVVNGEIVADETTLTIDRPGQAAADIEAQLSGAVEEENDLTKRVNRLTHLNKRRRDPIESKLPTGKLKSDPWSEEETERFYEALKMFGTDFFIISKMFTPKTRKQIKLKFVREERLDPRRINDAVMGKSSKPMDLEHYARETGREVADFTKYNDSQAADAAIRESFRDREEQMREKIRQREEDERQKLIAAQCRKPRNKDKKKTGGATFGGSAPTEQEGGG